MSTTDPGPTNPEPPANLEPTANPAPTPAPEPPVHPPPTPGREGTPKPAQFAGTERTAKPDRTASNGRRWLQRLIIVVAAIVVGVLAYFVVAAFIPRWWAQRVAHQVDSKFTLGIVWGLFYGGIFTFVAVLLALQARRPMFRWPIKIGLIVVALLLEIPNLMTLGIVIGTSHAAHAGQRILDVEAPAFRSATVAGVIVGALLAIGVFILVTLVRQRGRQIKALQAQIKQHALADQDDAAGDPARQRPGDPGLSS